MDRIVASCYSLCAAQTYDPRLNSSGTRFTVIRTWEDAKRNWAIPEPVVVGLEDGTRLGTYPIFHEIRLEKWDAPLTLNLQKWASYLPISPSKLKKHIAVQKPHLDLETQGHGTLYFHDPDGVVLDTTPLGRAFDRSFSDPTVGAAKLSPRFNIFKAQRYFSDLEGRQFHGIKGFECTIDDERFIDD